VVTSFTHCPSLAATAPQVVANVLWALQRLTASCPRVPPRLAEELLRASRQLLEATAAADPEVAGAKVIGASAEVPAAAAGDARSDTTPPPHQQQRQQHSPRELFPDLMASVVWSVGRLHHTGAVRLDPNEVMEADGWVDAAVGASIRLLRQHVAATGGARGVGPSRLSEQQRQLRKPWAAGQAGAAAVGPRSLAALADGLAMLEVSGLRTVS
jgi:hypothetical protein